MNREESSYSDSSRVRVAGLDLGTNTCLVLIADVDVRETDGVRTIQSLKPVRDEVRVVRLGQDVGATMMLHPEALARAEATFKEFSGYIQSAGCERVLAVATSAARDSGNGARLVELGAQYGIPIEIITGEKEAELTFAGAIESSWVGLTAIIDVGGGSTEIIFGDQNGIVLRFSADVGSVRLTERLVKAHPVASSELKALQQTVRTSLEAGFDRALLAYNEKLNEKLAASPDSAPNSSPQKLTREALLSRIQQVIGVAGTPTTLAAVDLGHAFESERVHGHVFLKKTLEEWTTKLARLTVAQRQQLAGMEPKRADVIVAGAVCLTESMQILGASELKVSVRGLRYGVAGLIALR